MDAPDYNLALLVPNDMYASDARKVLTAVDAALLALPGDAIDVLGLDIAMRAVAAEQGIRPDALFRLLRVALRGNLASPGLYDTVAALGRDGVRQRIAAARTRLSDIATTSD